MKSVDGSNGCTVPVLFFGDQWDKRKRRRQQLASRLAERHEVSGVLYVESPLPLTSLAKALLGKADPDAAERWQRMNQVGNLFQPGDSDTRVCTPRSFFRLTGLFCVDRLQRAMVKRRLIQSCRALWQGRPSEIEALTIVTHPWLPVSFYRSLGLAIDCYDCTDDFTSFYEVPGSVRRMLRRNDEDLARSARVVTCVSDSLFQQKLRLNPNSHLVANGVDIELFANSNQPIGIRWKYSIPDDAKILGYVGGVNKRVDTNLLRTIVESKPGFHIVIAGINTETSLGDVAGIHLLGQLPLEQVGAFLGEVDVCLIPHKVDDLTKSMDPQKIYDYLAAGKPIVSTPVAGTERYQGLIHVAETTDEFISAIETSLNDNNTLRSQRLAAAAACSWTKRVDQFWSLVTRTYAARAICDDAGLGCSGRAPSRPSGSSSLDTGSNYTPDPAPTEPMAATEGRPLHSSFEGNESHSKDEQHLKDHSGRKAA